MERLPGQFGWRRGLVILGAALIAASAFSRSGSLLGAGVLLLCMGAFTGGGG